MLEYEGPQKVRILSKQARIESWGLGSYIPSITLRVCIGPFDLSTPIPVSLTLGKV